MPLRLGTRGSALAQWQANWVAGQLRDRGHDVEIVNITTRGDRHFGAIDRQAAQGLFTKEIQTALLEGAVDLAVHSLKDLPTESVAGLMLAAVPHRASPADALLSSQYPSLAALPTGAVVGTGSRRRRAQLLRARPDLTMADLRGNVDTRIRKLHEGQYAAIVLAEAGLRRLGFDGEIREVLPFDVMLPAVGQAALGIEARIDDEETIVALSVIDDPPTHFAVLAERALLAALHGGCLAPIAAHAEATGEELSLRGRVLSPDGTRAIEASRSASMIEAELLGQRVADDLLAQGAAELIAACRD